LPFDLIFSYSLLMSQLFFGLISMKVDRLYGWKKCTNAPIGKALRQQNEDVKREFNMRLTDVRKFPS